MPAGNVSISAEFEAVYAVTFEAPTNGTLAVAKGEDTLTSGDTVAAGSTITITATPADFYKIDTLTIGGTAYTKAADASDPQATEYVVAADGTVTGTATVTAATAVAATFTENLVASWDFEGDSPTQFVRTDPSGNRSAVEVIEDATLKSKVEHFEAKDTNARASALLDFSSYVANTAKTKVTFDVKYSGSRGTITLGDISLRGNDCGGSTSGSKVENRYTSFKGSMFYLRRNDSNKFTVMEADKNDYANTWLHVEVMADYTTRKITYDVKTVDDSTSVVESTTIDYKDADAAAMNCMDIFGYVTGSAYLDNINVYTKTGTAGSATVNYVDGDGNVLKDATTISSPVGTIAAATSTNKTAFDYTDSESGTKYYCTYSGTTDSVTVTGNAETDKIDLVFTKTPYVTVPVKHVYEDTSGTITVGEKTYTEFGTDGSATGVSGDTYTIEDSYKTAIDDTTTTKAFYVFGSQLTNTLAADTPLYVLYTKNDYKTTTFSLTIPSGLTDDAGLDIPVKVSGTPDAVGATALTDKVVTVTVAQNATTGSATIDLLDSTAGYSYVIDDVAQKYLGASGAVAAGGTVTKELETNSKTPATITVKYVDADNTETVIKTETIDLGVYVGEEYTAADTYTATFTKQVGETTVPYKKYTYHADGSDSLTITPTGTDDVITLKYDTDGKQYYYENDFEDSDAGVTGWTPAQSDRYTVTWGSENEDANHFAHIAIGTKANGDNGTNITGSSWGTLGTESSSGYIVEFDFRNNTTSYNNGAQILIGTSTYAWASGSGTNYKPNRNYTLKLAQTGGTTWKVNDAADAITLDTDVYYHVKTEHLADGINVTITKKSDGTTVLATTKYLAENDEYMLTTPIKGIYTSTGRYNKNYDFDNIAVYTAE